MRGWWSALGSVTNRNLGSQKAAWIWLVKVPGLKWAIIGIAPVAATNFSTAQWLVFLEDVTLTSAVPSVGVLFHLEVKVGAT